MNIEQLAVKIKNRNISKDELINNITDIISYCKETRDIDLIYNFISLIVDEGEENLNNPYYIDTELWTSNYCDIETCINPLIQIYARAKHWYAYMIDENTFANIYYDTIEHLETHFFDNFTTEDYNTFINVDLVFEQNLLDIKVKPIYEKYINPVSKKLDTEHHLVDFLCESKIIVQL